MYHSMAVAHLVSIVLYHDYGYQFASVSVCI